jgi:hypothetical protein
VPDQDSQEVDQGGGELGWRVLLHRVPNAVDEASIEVTRPHELTLYVRMFDLLAAAAVYGQAARALMGRVLDDLRC